LQIDRLVAFAGEDQVGGEGALPPGNHFLIWLRAPFAPQLAEIFEQFRELWVLRFEVVGHVMRAQTVLLAVELEEGRARFRPDLSAHTPTGIEQKRGQEDGHLDTVPLRAVKDGDRAAQLHVVTRRRIAFDGVNQPEGLNLSQYAPKSAHFLPL